MNKQGKWFLGLSAGLLVGVVCLYHFSQSLWRPVHTRLTGGRTVQDVLDQYGPDAEARLTPHFERAGLAYPPKSVAFVGLKQEKQLELWAKDDGTDWTFIHTYPVLAASGVAGPKLREGDKQVPEGIYRIEGLNPNRCYHLSMKLDYPNAFDLERAKEDGRANPGTNIFIHGKAASVGCLAMGDSAIEELFVLVAKAGKENVRVILLPNDPETHALSQDEGMPTWTQSLYEALSNEAKLIRLNDAR